MAVSLEAPRAITALDAVNIALREIGEDPVSSLGPGAKPTAQKAENILAERSVFVQSQGWNFCAANRLLLAVNGDGNIQLPNNLLSFEPVDVNMCDRLIADGGRLFDTYTNTFVFTAGVYVRAVLARPFADLPQHARWYIALLTAVDLTNSENPDSNSIRITAQSLRDARVQLARYDRRLRKGGLRRFNKHIQRMRRNR